MSSVNYAVKKAHTPTTNDKFTSISNIQVSNHPPPNRRVIKIVKGSSPLLPNKKCKGNQLQALAGNFGVYIRIAFFFLVAISDGVLLFVLWRRWNQERDFYVKQVYFRLFVTSCVIAILPFLIVNILRYTNVISTGTSSSKGPRRNSKRNEIGEEYSHTKEETRRDMEILDAIKCSIHEVPQLFCHGFWLFKGTRLWSQVSEDEAVVMAQACRVILAIVVLAWSIAAYQDSVHVSFNDRPNRHWKSVFVVFWRLCEVTSRALALLSFASLEVTGEGGLIKTTQIVSSFIPSFAVLCIIVIILRFVACSACVYLEQTKSVYEAQGGTSQLKSRIAKAFLIGWISSFSFVNTHNHLKRRRLILCYFFYGVENTFLVAVVFLQMITVDEWRRISLLSVVELLTLKSAMCAFLYYGFIHITVPTQLEANCETQ